MKCKENRKSKRKRKIKTIKIYNIKGYYIDASVNKKIFNFKSIDRTPNIMRYYKISDSINLQWNN